MDNDQKDVLIMFYGIIMVLALEPPAMRDSCPTGYDHLDPRTCTSAIVGKVNALCAVHICESPPCLPRKRPLHNISRSFQPSWTTSGTRLS